MLFSSLGWYSAQIMPDIFTSFLILTIFLFIKQNALGWKAIIFYLFLFFQFVVSHSSNILISLLTLLIIFSYYLVKYRKAVPPYILKRIAYLSLVWICSIQFLMIDNYYNGMGYILSPSSNVFIAARLSETGILKEYLDDNCAKNNYSLCKYKDSLPEQASTFLWASYGPFQKEKLGWLEADKEYAPIVRGVFTTPKYLKLFLWESVKGTIEQLFQVDIGSGLCGYGAYSAPYYPIKVHLGDSDLNEFLNSEQGYRKWQFTFLNFINYFVLSISLLIISLCFYNNWITHNMKTFIKIILMGVFLNAAITASLANVYSRLQARVTWLIVFAAICCLIQIIPIMVKYVRTKQV